MNKGVFRYAPQIVCMEVAWRQKRVNAKQDMVDHRVISHALWDCGAKTAKYIAYVKTTLLVTHLTGIAIVTGAGQENIAKVNVCRGPTGRDVWKNVNA